jgi:ABC-type multidrug transport system ATPase subunit
MQTIISVSDLSKTYASGFQALRNIDLDIRRGEIFGLLGPNGAGKSTLMRALSGLHRPVGGGIALAGEDIAAQKPIDCVPGEPECADAQVALVLLQIALHRAQMRTQIGWRLVLRRRT